MLGLGIIVALVLLVLKLAGLVALSWWVVAAPVLVALAVIVVWWVVVGGLIVAVAQAFD